MKKLRLSREKKNHQPSTLLCDSRRHTPPACSGCTLATKASNGERSSDAVVGVRAWRSVSPRIPGERRYRVLGQAVKGVHNT